MKPKELKTLRLAAGLSQSGLARALGVHVMSVSRWERGTVSITTMTERALRAFFSGKVGAKSPRTSTPKSKTA